MGNNVGKDLFILSPIGLMAAGIAGKGDTIVDAAEDLGLAIENAITGQEQSRRSMYPPWTIANQYLRGSWMAQMSENISETRLIDLKLLGTHDSASYSCNQYVAMCQNADIKEQLVRGIRFLDIRIGWDFKDRPGGVRVGHGEYSWGTSFENIISDIYDFVSTNPKEFIIILNGKAAGLENQDKSFIQDQYTQRLGKWMVKDEDNFDLSIVKLKDLWEKDRRLWVFNDDWNDILNIDYATGKKLGLWPKSPYLYGKYADTTNNDTMYSEINNQLSIGKQTNALLLHYLTLTPRTLQAMTYGVETLTLDLQVPNTYKVWFEEKHCNFRINIIIMDFVFGASEEACKNQLNFLDLVINSNNSKENLNDLVHKYYAEIESSITRPKRIKNKNNEFLCTNRYVSDVDFIKGTLVVSNSNIDDHFWQLRKLGEISDNRYLLLTLKKYFRYSINCEYYAYLSAFDSNSIINSKKYGLEKDSFYANIVDHRIKAKIWILEDCGEGFLAIKEERSGLYLKAMENRDKESKYIKLSDTKEIWKIE